MKGRIDEPYGAFQFSTGFWNFAETKCRRECLNRWVCNVAAGRLLLIRNRKAAVSIG